MAWAFEGLNESQVFTIPLSFVIYWVKQVGALLPDAYEPEAVPQVGELDELETFVEAKKTKSGCGQR